MEGWETEARSRKSINFRLGRMSVLWDESGIEERRTIVLACASPAEATLLLELLSSPWSALPYLLQRDLVTYDEERQEKHV